MNTRFALLTLSVAICATACAAQQVNPAPATNTTTLFASRSNMLARSGGIVQTPFTGPVILFLNTQKRVPATALQETANQIQKTLRLPCTFSAAKETREPLADAIQALTDNKKNTAAVILICDSANQPALLVAPESRWALVNVAALVDKNESDDKLAERVQKEIWRAFGYVMGAANSNFENCLLKPVFSLEDLDALKSKMICPEAFNKVLAQAQKLGIKSARMITYRKAVEEGWAPSPTNDFQRAIWQELKKTPAK